MNTEIKKIKRVKIIKGTTALIDYEVVKPDGIHVLSDLSESIVHPDFLKSFEGFVPHIIHISDQNKTKKVPNWLFQTDEDLNDITDPEEIEEIKSIKEPFTCTGFTITNGDMIVLHCSQKLSTTGQIWNYTLPKCPMDDEYNFFEHLNTVLAKCIEEANKYMEGKSAQVQLELEKKSGPQTAKEALSPNKGEIKNVKEKEVGPMVVVMPEKPKSKFKTKVTPKGKEGVKNTETKTVKINPFERVGAA